MTEPGITPQEIVGRNLRAVRSQRGTTQEALGAALKAYLGKGWARQAVSAAEAGHREFTALELYALAGVLRCDVSILLAYTLAYTARPTADELLFEGKETIDLGDVIFPSGKRKSREDYIGEPLLGPESNRAILADAARGLSEVEQKLAQLVERVQFAKGLIEEGEAADQEQEEER